MFEGGGQDLANLRASLKGYAHLSEYVKKHPEARPVFQEEFEICEQLVELLPLKIEGIRLGKLPLEL
eukprot:3124494-Pyramimonas_sp.AAC.1